MSARSHLDGLPFPPDAFQVEAAAGIDAGESVVVSAPTGSGKTVVAEAAIARALGRGNRAVYTTPIKALSNQKFGDLRRVYGDARVGLLTGDNTINPAGDIVVMTTEVLRNMMYADSAALETVGVVVLDEVHYLQDRERGAVWEEIIIHLGDDVPLVCLSATIANAGEFAEWIADRRGPTRLVVAEERPVPLESLYLVRDLWDRNRLRAHPVFHGTRPNEKIAKMLRSGGGRRYASPRRYETAVMLRRHGLLPAIYFIFSRAGCDAAVSTVVDRGLQLTGPGEREEIREVARHRLAHLSADDLLVLGHDRWLRSLMEGVAAHHAGIVPAMKETVEELFAAGLVKLVFATETLALGINMPARSVVIESLSKFTGEAHELIQPGDYTQLTGRAGRRGIDSEGTALVLHSPYVDFHRVAGIASQGSHPLESSFRPTYNMAVNLIARYDEAQAERLLRASFASFRSARRSEGSVERIERDLERLADLRAELDALGVSTDDMPRQPPSRAQVMASFASGLRSGDVLEVPHGASSPRRHALVARGTGSRPRLITIDDTGAPHRLAATRLPDGVAFIGHIEMPRPKQARDPGYRRDVADRLRRLHPDPSLRRAPDVLPEGAPERLAADLVERIRRIEERAARHRRRSESEPDGEIVTQFRRIIRLLEDLAYVTRWDLTVRGSRLRRIYNANDLVLCEALDAGLFDGLAGPETAALASAFTYEPRRGSPESAWPEELERRAERLHVIWEEVTTQERAHGLQPSRPLEHGFAATALTWARGAPLGLLFDGEAAIGDFVRTTRQLLDLLRQVDESGHPGAPGTRDAMRALDRGVVAALGVS